MADDILPALSPSEWAGVLAHRRKLDEILEQLLDTPFSGHAVAALLLYGQPFGFTQQDVDDEMQVAAYCDAMAAEHEAAGQREIAATFRQLGERHRARARKLEALLPPASLPDAGRDDVGG